MTDKDEPAFPQGMPEHGSKPGLTKREYFASLAMQGMLSFGEAAGFGDERVPKLAVIIADKLILELEK